MLLLRHIDANVQDYFGPWLDLPTGFLPILRDMAGMADPYMARQHYLFHTAMDALCFCQLHPHLLEKPGSNVFTAIGSRPTAAQLLGLKHRLPNARTVGVFDDDLCGRVLDCKVALWQMRRDASFRLDGQEIMFTYGGSPYRIPLPLFSLHRFRTATGFRSAYRTAKPNGAVSYAAMLAARQAAHTTKSKRYDTRTVQEEHKP